jgi:hypothetical protein
MSNWQGSLAATQPSPFGSTDTRPAFDFRFIAGLALIGLGAALFAVGIFHGFANGSCSMTGYTAHYGPIQHCGKGIGWWMLMILGGILVAALGGVLSATAGGLMIAVMFVAIGAPFIGLAVRNSNVRYLAGSSASTGKISVAIFGGCFVLAGLVWAAFAARSVFSRINGGTRLISLVAAVAGVAVALAIGTGVSGAIGNAAPPSLQQVSQGGGGASQANLAAQQAAAKRTEAAVKQAKSAIKQATAQADQATKLAACVSSASTNVAKVQACEAKYMP